MNAHRILPLLLLFVAVRADPEFVGVLTSKESGKLFVVAPSPGAPARWVKIGDEIDGYFVTESRDGDEVLVLKKGHREFVLRLKGSRTQHADYRGALMPLVAAKQLIESLPGWQSDVLYNVFQRKDGVWCLQAARPVGKAMQVRFIPLTTESVSASTHK
jgi:hypothetical protein